MDTKDSQVQGQELIIEGREVFSKQGHNRLGWLRNYPQSGGSSDSNTVLEGRELMIKGKQVFDVKDQNTPIGFLSEQFVGGSSGGYGGASQGTQQQTR